MTKPALTTLKLMPPRRHMRGPTAGPAKASHAIRPAQRADEVRMRVCSWRLVVVVVAAARLRAIPKIQPITRMM